MRINRLAVLLLALASTLQAVTFTAARRYDKRYDTKQLLTITVPDQGPVAVMRFPSHLVPGYDWPPPIAILFNGADSFDGTCARDLNYEEFGTCASDLVPKDRGNGTSEIRFPVKALRAAIAPHHFRQERYETCLRTNGAEDILTGGRCPIVGDGGLGEPSIHVVDRPHDALILRLDLRRGDGIKPEFYFLTDTQSLRDNNAAFLREDGQPLESHYGELDRMMAWYKLSEDNPQEPNEETEEPEEGLTTITYDTTNVESILGAMSALVDILSPKVNPGVMTENYHVVSIRWHVGYLNDNPQEWLE